MNKIRSASIDKNHKRFVDLLRRETPSRKKSALLQYVRKYGITHCLFINLDQVAREHLCTLDFFFEYLKVTPSKHEVHKTVRALQIKEHSALWQTLLLQKSPPPEQKYGSLMNFCLFANWYSSVLSLSSWVEQQTSIGDSLRHDALMLKTDALYANDNHTKAIETLQQQNIEGLSSEQQEEINTRLGIIYLRTNNFKDAQQMFLAQVQKYRAQSPVAVGELSNALHNLGAAYRRQGEFKLAHDALQEALFIRRQELGEEDIATLLTKQNLAVVLRSLDREREAKPILLDVSQKYERMLGEQHQYTITVHNNLGLVLRDLEEHEEAYNYMQRAKNSCFVVFGSTHSMSLTIQMQCAVILKRTERYLEAAQELRYVAAKQTEIFGEHHLNTLTTQYKLATTLVFLEDDHDQEITLLFEKIYEQRKKQLGSVHPSTMVILSTRIEYMEMKDRYQEAIELYPLLITAQKDRFGERHAKVLLSTYNLGKLHLKCQQPQKAIQSLQETLDGEIERYGKDSEDIAMTYWNLARAHRMNNTPDQAAIFRKRCWEIEVIHSNRWNIESLKTAVAYAKDLLASGNIQEAQLFYIDMDEQAVHEELNKKQLQQLYKMKECIESHGSDI